MRFGLVLPRDGVVVSYSTFSTTAVMSSRSGTAAAEFAHRSVQPGDDLLRTLLASGRKNLADSRFAEHLTVGRLGFHQPIGQQQHDVAGLELHGGCGRTRHPARSPAAAPCFPTRPSFGRPRPARTPPGARADTLDRPQAGIEPQQQQRHEPPFFRLSHQRCIGPGEDLADIGR